MTVAMRVGLGLVVAVVAGVLVFLNQIQPEELGYGAVDAVVTQSVIWIVVLLALTAIGAAFQAYTTQGFALAWADEPSDPTAPAY